MSTPPPAPAQKKTLPKTPSVQEIVTQFEEIHITKVYSTSQMFAFLEKLGFLLPVRAKYADNQPPKQKQNDLKRASPVGVSYKNTHNTQKTYNFPGSIAYQFVKIPQNNNAQYTKDTLVNGEQRYKDKDFVYATQLYKDLNYTIDQIIQGKWELTTISNDAGIWSLNITDAEGQTYVLENKLENKNVPSNNTKYLIELYSSLEKISIDKKLSPKSSEYDLLNASSSSIDTRPESPSSPNSSSSDDSRISVQARKLKIEKTEAINKLKNLTRSEQSKPNIKFYVSYPDPKQPLLVTCDDKCYPTIGDDDLSVFASANSLPVRAHKIFNYDSGLIGSDVQVKQAIDKKIALLLELRELSQECSAESYKFFEKNKEFLMFCAPLNSDKEKDRQKNIFAYAHDFFIHAYLDQKSLAAYEAALTLKTEGSPNTRKNSSKSKMPPVPQTSTENKNKLVLLTDDYKKYLYQSSDTPTLSLIEQLTNIDSTEKNKELAKKEKQELAKEIEDRLERRGTLSMDLFAVQLVLNAHIGELNDTLKHGADDFSPQYDHPQTWVIGGKIYGDDESPGKGNANEYYKHLIDLYTKNNDLTYNDNPIRFHLDNEVIFTALNEREQKKLTKEVERTNANRTKNIWRISLVNFLLSHQNSENYMTLFNDFFQNIITAHKIQIEVCKKPKYILGNKFITNPSNEHLANIMHLEFLKTEKEKFNKILKSLEGQFKDTRISKLQQFKDHILKHIKDDTAIVDDFPETKGKSAGTHL